jgi:transcriptional regulator with XRE-family HTH domain
MVNNKRNPYSILAILGKRLKEARLHRNESQETFAARIGLSRQSYSKMEKGSPTIGIGYWLTASDILGRLDTWQNVLEENIDLFEQFEKQQSRRQRAGKKKSQTK